MPSGIIYTFPLWSLTTENGPSDAQRGPGLVKASPVEGLLAWWKKGVLLACYVTQRGDRPEEGEGRSVGRGVGVMGHNNGLSQVRRAHQLSVFSCNLRKWNLVKLVSSWVPIAWVMWLGKGVTRERWGCVWGAGTALIDTFSSSERAVKSTVVLNAGIPGQTGCLHGDDWGERRVSCYLWWDWMLEMDMEWQVSAVSHITHCSHKVTGLQQLSHLSVRQRDPIGGFIQRVKGHDSVTAMDILHILKVNTGNSYS